MLVLANFLSATTGGSVSYLRNMLPALAERFRRSPDHRLCVLVYRDQTLLFEAQPELDVRVIEGHRPTGARRVLWERCFLRSHVADADVHFVPYQVGRTGLARRTVLMLRNMEPFLSKNYRYAWQTRLRNMALSRLSAANLRAADRVIAVSDFAQQFARTRLGMPEDRLRRIWHGRDPAFEAGQAPGDRNRLAALGVTSPYLFTSGSVLPYRRFEDVIAAFSALAPRHPDLRLVITGTGTDLIYRKLVCDAIEASGAKDRIVWPGYVVREDMTALYRNALAFVTATEIEACPNTVIEALASGCAIVASQCDPLPEFIKDAALYYPPRNVAALEGQIRQFVENPDLRKRYSKRALQNAERFSWTRCADTTFEALTHW